MRSIFNFSNFKDSSYVLLLCSVVLSLSTFQTVLVPSLDYVALSIKGNNSFYNYALVGSLAATIPSASSLIAGYLVNNVVYKKLISIIFLLITSFSIVIAFLHQNFAIYASYVISVSILFNALIFGVDRQVVTLLATKIREYQNDLFIFGSIMAIINYKISNLIYTYFHLNGIIIYCVCLNLVIHLCLRQVPALENIMLSQEDCKSPLPSLKALFKIMAKHRTLLVFWGFMLAIILTFSGLTLLFTTKIHHENLPTSLWSSNMALMASGSLVGALLCRTEYMQKINSIFLICTCVAVMGICIISTAKITSINGMLGALFVFGFFNPMVLISMNTFFAKYISKDNELIAISPVVNGLIASSFYVISLIGPSILNPLLQHGVNYKLLLLTCGSFGIILAMTFVSVGRSQRSFA